MIQVIVVDLPTCGPRRTHGLEPDPAPTRSPDAIVVAGAGDALDPDQTVATASDNRVTFTIY